jgi:hypothetical protein
MSKSPIEQAHEGRRQIDSAGALFRDGLVDEAHAYMTRALHETLEAWVLAAPKDETDCSDSSPESKARRATGMLAGARYRAIDRLKAALVATTDGERRPLPTHPRVAKPDFEWIWAEAERLSRFTVRHFTPPLVRKRARRRAAIALGVGALVVLAFLGRLWGRPRVMASTTFSPEYPVSLAVDGIDSTEWLLPDGALGWLQIAFRSPRRIESVRVTNAHNRTYLDRGAKQVKLTAFSEQGPVGSAEGRFERVTSERSELDIPLRAERVTYLRVEVLSYFGLGGGLAEVEVR